MSIFISHGAPDLALRTTKASQFLEQYQAFTKPPKAIIIFSAHWMEDIITINTHPKPSVIYDFTGFPKELYELQYATTGSPEIAENLSDFLNKNGVQATINNEHGIDHGVWSPLRLMLPNPPCPIIQVSLNANLSSKFHYELGQKLQEFDKEILIIGSGSMTHNLRLVFQRSFETDPKTSAFVNWFSDKIQNNDRESMLNWQKLAPNAAFCHPTIEHFIPFFIALGAGGQGHRLHHSFDMGNLSMDLYEFN